MKYSLQNIFYALAATALLTGCEAEFDNPVGDTSTYTNGTADFSNFVAVGDSLTAGYKDGALYRIGQENSYGAILAQQFALVGGGAFNQPLMLVGDTGSMTFSAAPIPLINDRLVLVPTGDPNSPAAPFTITPTQSTEILVPLAGAFNNIGVPAAKSFHIVAGSYGDPAGFGTTANPFFARFANSTTTSMIFDAASQFPSFFILWIGNNDILLYAVEGGANTDALTKGTYGLAYADVTDPVTFFAPSYNEAVATLKTVSNKGVLINIPDVSTIPYFTTIPYNAIPLSLAQAGALQAVLGDPYNDALDLAVLGAAIPQAEADLRYLNFVEGINPILITDEEGLIDLTGLPTPIPSMRFATANDYILLPSASKLNTDAGGGLVWGISAPLEDGDVLTEFEAGFVETARVAYNATILLAAAADPDLLHFDASAMLTELNTSGIFYGTGGITSTFATGGGFSLDGVHPTARGYAVIANAIIDVINTGFSASIPHVDPGAYTTVFYQ